MKREKRQRKNDATKPGTKSRYAIKQIRKMGRGELGGEWMSWFEPRRPDVSLPTTYRDRIPVTPNERIGWSDGGVS